MLILEHCSDLLDKIRMVSPSKTLQRRFLVIARPKHWQKTLD